MSERKREVHARDLRRSRNLRPDSLFSSYFAIKNGKVLNVGFYHAKIMPNQLEKINAQFYPTIIRPTRYKIGKYESRFRVLRTAERNETLFPFLSLPSDAFRLSGVAEEPEPALVHRHGYRSRRRASRGSSTVTDGILPDESTWWANPAKATATATERGK